MGGPARSRMCKNFDLVYFMMKLVPFLSLLSFLFLTLPLKAADKYAVIKFDGSVNPIMADYVDTSIKAAQQQGMEFIVIQLNTPGGLVSSMQEIIQTIMSSSIPVVVYTYPRGAHAASAGGYIMLAANVAVMAPATNIGAMHPVSLLDLSGSGNKEGQGGIMGLKALNDLLAYARGLAQKRHRNVEWTERAVRYAISSTYLEALHMGVIDFVAEDMNDLLHKLNDRTLNMNGKTFVFRTRNIEAVYFHMDWKQEFLNFFADPQMVLLLLVVAVVGIGWEIKSPGLIAPGVIGAIALFLFLMVVRILPVRIAGLLLILLTIVFFILEIKFMSYGLLTLGGIASFVVGSMILFESPLPGGAIPLTTIVGTMLVLMAFFFLVVRALIRAHHSKVTTGREGLIGEEGTVLVDFDEQGMGKIRIHGEIWDAQGDATFRKGDEVVVADMRGMKLIVNKK
jgi:membrane-bound serine protease (ClpP class)